MGLLDFLRPQPPLVSLLRLPAGGAPVRAAVSFEGKLATQLAASIGSWVPPRRGSSELLRAFAELPWLHAVVKRRAEALAQVEWVLYRAKGKRGRAHLKRTRVPPGPEARSVLQAKTRATAELIRAGELELVLDHPFLKLLERPWPGGSEVAFWRLSSQHQDLLGETLWGMERNAKGEPAELLPIVPTWVRRIPSPGQPFFEIVPPSGKGFLLSVNDAVWIRQLDPLDPFMGRGVGTAGALNDELETDEYMAMTAKSRFFNRAIPEVVLGLLGGKDEPPPGPAAIQEIAQGIEEKHRGGERAGQLHLISGDFKAQHLGQTMVENQHIQGREFLRNTFMQVFGTPPEVCGILDNANRSTIDAAAFHFAVYSTIPVIELHRSALQEQVLPEYGDDLVLDYVSPIPSDREFDRSVMVALPASFTKNEIRALAGRPPRKDGEDYYAAATGNVPTPGEKGPPPEKPTKKNDEVDDADDA